MDVRFPRRDLGCTTGGVGVEKLAAGVRIPFGHTHTQQEEIYVIAEGSGRVKIDDEIRDLRRWDILRVGPGVMRNFEGGPDGMTVIAFGAPLGEGNFRRQQEKAENRESGSQATVIFAVCVAA